MSWGIAPQALLGHGVGEWVAACLAGVMALPDALTLLALRQGMEEGAFAAAVGKVALRVPEIPFVSSVTGTWITAAQAADPAYWARHPLPPEDSGAGLDELLGDPRRILLEVGPGGVLSALAEGPPRAAGLVVVPSAGLLGADADADPQGALLAALGRLWLAGLRLDWAGFYRGEGRRRVAPPPYPF